MQCSLDHIVLNVLDVDSMLAFYSEILLLPPERLNEYRQGKVPFPSVRLNRDTVIDLFPPEMWRKTNTTNGCNSNLNHFCIAMEEPTWEELLGRLQIGQVQIESGPVQRWGAHGTGTSVYFRDPENNLIEARYYQEQERTETCLLGS